MSAKDLVTLKNEGYLVEEELAKLNFNDNWLKIFDGKHKDIPMQYKIEFIQKAQLTGADPRLDHIYLTGYFSPKLGHKVGTTIINYNYLVKCAQDSKEYKGIQCVVEPEDIFNPHTSKVEEQLTATATVYRKDCEPYTHKVLWSEFNNPKNPIWKTKPYAMLRKCAIAGALRMLFPLAAKGMMIEEEMEREIVNVKEGDYAVRDKSEEIAESFAEKPKGITLEGGKIIPKEDVAQAVKEPPVKAALNKKPKEIGQSNLDAIKEIAASV